VNRYVAIVGQDDAGGFSAWSPDLPGCVAAASTFDGCVRLMREAVAFHLDGMREGGLPTPKPSAVGVFIIDAA
jgi:predicted RNase H-like HicB family nuclease